MKVLLDARKISDGGIGSYTVNLAEALINSGKVNLTLIVRKKNSLPFFSWLKKVSLLELDIKPYSVEEMFVMPYKLEQNSFDLLHVPHYTLPFGAKIPTVVTIHDLIHISHPEKRYYPYVAKPLISSAVKRASEVIAVSKATRDELLKLVNKKNAKKITVVKNCLPVDLYNEVSKRGLAPSILKFSPNTESYTPFILTVLSLNKPHKGVDDLLNIIFSLSQEMEKGNIKWCNFVIAGYGSDKLKEKELSLLIKRRFSNTYFLGSVSQPLLYSLYKSTEALLIPSVAEGFCLPAIEAMAYGTPVICRPVPAILEHLIENNFVAKDMSTEALKECVKRFIQEKITYLRSHSGKKQEVKRTRTINKEFLEKYSPYNHAREVLEVYRKALSQKGGVKEGSAAKESVINS